MLSIILLISCNILFTNFPHCFGGLNKTFQTISLLLWIDKKKSPTFLIAQNVCIIWLWLTWIPIMDLILFLVFYVKESKHQLLADLTVHLAHLFHSRNATSLCFITSYFIQSSCVALTIPLPPPGCPHLSRPFYCILLLYIGHYCTSLKSPLVVSEMRCFISHSPVFWHYWLLQSACRHLC